MRQAFEGGWARIRISDGEQHHQPVRVKAAGDKGEALDRLRVEPLRVVDDAHQRATGGCVAQHGQRGEADEEPGGRRRLGGPERRIERGPLGHGQPFGLGLEREQETVQTGIGHLDLGLDAGESQDSHRDLLPLGRLHGQVEYRGLADPRGASKHQRAGAFCVCTGDKVLDHAAFPLATQQLIGLTSHRHPSQPTETDDRRAYVT